MNELEDYKEEKPELQNNVVENETPKKKKMSLTTKIFICLIIFCICLLVFKFSYKPKTDKLIPAPQPTTISNIKTSVYDLKSEVSKFLQKQIEYIM